MRCTEDEIRGTGRVRPVATPMPHLHEFYDLHEFI